MTKNPLTNQLGTGAIDAGLEQQLLARGIQFAANFTTPHGTTFVVSSCHKDIYRRFAEQIGRAYRERHDLPAQYRIPIPIP